MRCIIYPLVTAPILEDLIHLSKLDIKDGFWRMMCAFREELNFACVLPNNPEAPTKLVIQSALQMG